MTVWSTVVFYPTLLPGTNYGTDFFAEKNACMHTGVVTSLSVGNDIFYVSVLVTVVAEGIMFSG